MEIQHKQIFNILEKVPNDIHLQICSYLTLKEIFIVVPSISKTIQQTCHQTKNQIIRIVISRYLGLDMFQNSLISKEPYQQIFEKIIQNYGFFSILQNETQNLVDLPILGFKTDGGIDDGNLEYWVDKAFSRVYNVICTKEGNNINIMGILDPSECPKQKYVQQQECERFLNQVLDIFAKKFQQQGNMQEGSENLHKMQIISTFLSASLDQLNFLIVILSQQLNCTPADTEKNIMFIKKYFSGQEDLKLKCYKQNLYVTKKGINQSSMQEQNDNQSNQQQQQQQQQQQSNSSHISQEYQDNSSIQLEEEKNQIDGPYEEEKNNSENGRNPNQEYPQYPILHSHTLEADTNIENLNRYIGVIKGIEISRSLEMLTCPVKTCVLFTSLQKIDYEKSEVVKQFNNIKTSQQICNLITSYNYQITKSNIQQLKPFCIEFDEKCQESSLQYVIFDNQLSQFDKRRLNEDNSHNTWQQQEKDYQIVKPVIWATFNDTNLWRYRFELIANRYFLGRYFLIRLIECENKMEEFLDQHNETNIDFNYCTFQGDLYDLEKSFKAQYSKNNSIYDNILNDEELNQNENYSKFNNFKLFENENQFNDEQSEQEQQTEQVLMNLSNYQQEQKQEIDLDEDDIDIDNNQISQQDQSNSQQQQLQNSNYNQNKVEEEEEIDQIEFDSFEFD